MFKVERINDVLSLGMVSADIHYEPKGSVGKGQYVLVGQGQLVRVSTGLIVCVS